MALDSRSTKILMLLLNNQSINGKQIEENLNISRKQVSYSLKKINDFLLDNNLNIITRTKTGKFIIPDNIYPFFNKLKTNINLNDYAFSEQERLILESLIILLRDEELSINHFVDILKVSTNTIFLDFKKMDKELNLKHMELLFDRRKGYYIEGEEFDKRLLIIEQIKKLLANSNGKQLFNIMFNVDKALIKQIMDCIKKIEESLSITYTDNIIEGLPYIIYAFMIRYQHNHFLKIMPLEYNNILGTNEFNSSFDILGEYFNNNSNEILLLTSQFKISSVNKISDNYLTKDIIQIAKLIINEFELLSCIPIYSDDLVKNLAQHLIPMIYRIKYGYHVEDYLLNNILPNHQSLFDITKESLALLKHLKNIEIPDEEVAYIAILFGGYLSKANLSLNKNLKKTAIVVCTNGISISNLLFQNLKKVFPEFYFKATLSKREFMRYHEHYDLIFSTVPLESDKPIYLVNKIMDDKTINALRKTVLNNNNSKYDIFIDHIIDIIDHNSIQLNKSHLKEELKDYFNLIDEYGFNSTELIDQNTNNLSKVLNNRIKYLQVKNAGWQTIIDICCEDLLLDNCITKQYIDEIKHLIKKDKPIWNISKDIIILHAGVDSGVNELGMSLTILDQPILINDYMQATILLVLASPNYNDHLNALYEFIEISEDKKKVDQLKRCNNINEIAQIINGGE